MWDIGYGGGLNSSLITAGGKEEHMALLQVIMEIRCLELQKFPSNVCVRGCVCMQVKSLKARMRNMCWKFEEKEKKSSLAYTWSSRYGPDQQHQHHLGTH